MFVETSLEVSPALSPKPLTPTVDTLPPLFIPSSLILSRSWSFAGESGLGTAAAWVDACVRAEMQLLWPSVVLVGLSLPTEQKSSIPHGS